MSDYWWCDRDRDHLVPPDEWARAWWAVRDRYCLAREVEERATCQALARLFELLLACTGPDRGETP